MTSAGLAWEAMAYLSKVPTLARCADERGGYLVVSALLLTVTSPALLFKKT